MIDFIGIKSMHFDQSTWKPKCTTRHKLWMMTIPTGTSSSIIANNHTRKFHSRNAAVIGHAWQSEPSGRPVGGPMKCDETSEWVMDSFFHHHHHYPFQPAGYTMYGQHYMNMYQLNSEKNLCNQVIPSVRPPNVDVGLDGYGTRVVLVVPAWLQAVSDWTRSLISISRRGGIELSSVCLVMVITIQFGVEKRSRDAWVTGDASLCKSAWIHSIFNHLIWSTCFSHSFPRIVSHHVKWKQPVWPFACWKLLQEIKTLSSPSTENYFALKQHWKHRLNRNRTK